MLIGSSFTSGPDADLIAKYNDLLIANFENLSTWKVVLVPQFDYMLTGDPREREMRRLGLRFFLSTRVRADPQRNVYVTAVLTDAWTEKNVWTYSVSGPEFEIESLALQIATLAHETLGDP